MGAAEVRTGSLLIGMGGATTVESISHTSDGIINPITTSGSILVAGRDGAPVVATHMTSGIGRVLLSSPGLALTKFSLSSALAYLFPSAVQAFYDAHLEDLYSYSKDMLDGKIVNY